MRVVRPLLRISESYIASKPGILCSLLELMTCILGIRRRSNQRGNCANQSNQYHPRSMLSEESHSSADGHG